MNAPRERTLVIQMPPVPILWDPFPALASQGLMAPVWLAQMRTSAPLGRTIAASRPRAQTRLARSFAPASLVTRVLESAA